MSSFHTIICGLLIAFLGCNSPYTPKPKGYFAIHFPEKKYRSFNQEGYPYSFEYPVYANISKDSLFFGESTENPWWINIDFPQFNSRIYISYKEVKKNNFEKLIADAFNLTNKHSSKASGIEDSMMVTPKKVNGMFFRVLGNVATANQFFLTDTANHFLRGALYFDASPNEDSLRIINDFIKEDMLHLINSFEWRNKESHKTK